MANIFKTLIKQPYWVLALIFGVVLATAPLVIQGSVSVGKLPLDFQKHAILLISFGWVLLLISAAAFGANLWFKRHSDAEGVDLTVVKEKQGILSTVVGGCEIQVIEGRVEEYQRAPGVAIALPCNEYFDDRCAVDPRSALGAFVNRFFAGQAEEFIALVTNEAGLKFGPGTMQQKTVTEQAQSFGSGRCMLLLKPLGRPDPVALISTTTQRAGQGLAAEISCLFNGMHELNECLADARINEVVMPVLGGGHGGIHPSLAFIGLLLAIAEAARYGKGAQRLKQVTILIFKKDSRALPEVDRTVVRRALALIGSQK